MTSFAEEVRAKTKKLQDDGEQLQKMLTEEREKIRQTLPKFVANNEILAVVTECGEIEILTDVKLSQEDTKKFVEWILKFFVRNTKAFKEDQLDAILQPRSKT